MARGFLGFSVAACAAGPVGAPPAVPVLGGTLAADEHGVVAADPATGRVLFATLSRTGRPTERGRTQLTPDAQPFRIALTETTAFVTLRGRGLVVAFDRRSFEQTASAPVCPEPRGVAVRDGDGMLVIRNTELLEIHLPEARAEVRHTFGDSRAPDRAKPFLRR